MLGEVGNSTDVGPDRSGGRSCGSGDPPSSAVSWWSRRNLLSFLTRSRNAVHEKGPSTDPAEGLVQRLFRNQADVQCHLLFADLECERDLDEHPGQRCVATGLVGGQSK